MKHDIVEQAGGIVYRITRGRPEILIVRAKKDPDHWIFPKGHIEKGESSEDAAVREVREEAGVVARIVRAVDPSLEFEFRGKQVRVQYYLMEATGEGRAEDDREQRWCRPQEALKTLTHDDARALLRWSVPDMLKEAR
jgi:8-oxo-dGTP pyrophosphatase MutT (NUDIX family)